MENISANMEKYRDAMLKDIAGLVEIESVRGEARDGKPYGEGPAQALEYCMRLGRELGLTVKNVGGHAMHAEYGEGDELVGVLAHCDVVPAGAGWTREPFKAVREGGLLYGRGTMDDKGPAVGAIYCLKALRDLGIRPKRRIRVILGASEEQGMGDMEYYFAHEQMPELGFSPDGEYPICNREKGSMHVSFRHAHDSAALVSLTAGMALNAVPFAATAQVAPAEGLAAAAKAREGAQGGGLPHFTFEEAGGCVKVQALGKSAHGSVPEEGVNAAMQLIGVLGDALPDGAGTLCRFLNAAAGLETDAASLGAAVSDRESGPLTLNIGIVHMGSGGDEAQADIRYPVTKNGGEIFAKIRETAARFGVEAEKTSDSAPLFVPEESGLVEKLKHAYETVTGEPAKTYSMGGGTYARTLKNGVAFGAAFRPESFFHIHGADEFIDIEEFMRHSGICLQAIYELACG